MKLQELRQGMGHMWSSVADGWERLRQSAAGALTRYKPGEKSNLPTAADVDDAGWLPGMGWAMLGGDVFEDDRRIVVRLEAPGMSRSDFDLQVLGDQLVVRGEKRFERESSDGRWHMLQCAYGSFQRAVPLPGPVVADEARANYRDGVLRVELPKARPGRLPARRIRVN
jgi:HSP20 family protein